MFISIANVNYNKRYKSSKKQTKGNGNIMQIKKQLSFFSSETINIIKLNINIRKFN